MAFTKKVVAGQTIAAADFAKFFGDHFSEFVKTGFEVSEGTGLVVDISAGTAYVKDASGYMYQIVSDATETTTLADDSTNYVFLHSNNGATYITDSTTATVPDDAILLATVVCASGDVTSVTDSRLLSPINPVPGTLCFNKVSPHSTSYMYFNTTGTKIITLQKCVYAMGGTSGGTAAAYYNVGGGEVSFASGDALDVSSTSRAFGVYIKFVTTTTNPDATPSLIYAFADYLIS